MKKKIIVIILIVAALLCILPLPRKVNCQTEEVWLAGWYLDFLFLTDRFYGEAEIEGQEYQPGENHAAFKFVDGDESVYMISIFRYRAETNDMEGRSIYLEENLQGLKEWN